MEATVISEQKVSRHGSSMVPLTKARFFPEVRFRPCFDFAKGTSIPDPWGCPESLIRPRLYGSVSADHLINAIMSELKPQIPRPSLDDFWTIPQALDFHYKHNTEEPIYVFSDKEDAKEPTTITFREFVHASDRAAEYLRPGRRGDMDGEVVGLILVTDTIQYQATLIGSLRAGLVPFPISQRLTPEAIVHLLKSSLSHRLIVTSKTLPTGLLDGIKSELNRDGEYLLEIQDMPALSYTFPKLGAETASHPHTRYPPPSRAPEPKDYALFLHSSGSTGLPKAIGQTHRGLINWARTGLPDLRYHNPRIRYSAIGLPPFHAIGFVACNTHTAFHGLSIAVFPPVDTASGALPPMPNPRSLLDHAKRNKVTGIICIPAFLNAWVHSKADVKFLASLEHVPFAGGTLSAKVGDALAAAGVNIGSIYGTTELGPGSRFQTRRGREKDWEWLEVSPQLNVEWVSQGDGTFELHSMIGDKYEPAVLNRSDKRGYATSDLFVQHPTDEKLWKIVGRVDDVVIHSSGEKTVPAPMEDIIHSSPIVQAAIVFGRDHDYPGVLIEVRPDYYIDTHDQQALDELRQRIWPQIQEANDIAPNYSRIFQEMILIARRDKPLPRSAKGTVMRKLALQAYAEEIEAIYKEVESTGKRVSVQPPKDWQANTVEKWLSNLVSQSHSGKLFTPTDDLFAQGFDSLSVTFLRSRVLSVLIAFNPHADEVFSLNAIYSRPTIRNLAQFISHVALNPGRTTDLEHFSTIDSMIERYSEGLGSSVLLTGSTGHLGSQILAELVANPSVSRVYAFNRPSTRSIQERHLDRFRLGNLDVEILKSNKLRLVEGDLSDKGLGISKELYDEIQQSVSLIIHTAWNVNFNLTLPSFEPHIRGVRNLIDLARNGPKASSLRFIFTSSVASAQSWDTKQGAYPEAVVRESKYALGNGYGESKYVAERILERSGLNSCSLRIGQLCGNSSAGVWSVSEWFPILVKSSIALGGLPSAPGLVSWIPIDQAARSILDLAFTKENIPFAMNLVHPRPVPWDHIIEAVQKALIEQSDTDSAGLPLIPLPEWMDKLSAKAQASTPADLEKIPAFKLIDFFRSLTQADQAVRLTKSDSVEFGGIASLAVQRAKEFSQTIQTCPSLNDADARRWVGYWRKRGFLG